MNTKILMMASSITLGIAGVIFTFLPGEVLNFIDSVYTDFNILFLQLLGALYFGFAILNWMARGNIIGGIYSKPLAIGNFAHFLIAGIPLIKSAIVTQVVVALWVAGIVYLLFALMFAKVAFGDPLINK